jgi:hypothetical protein
MGIAKSGPPTRPMHRISFAKSPGAASASAALQGSHHCGAGRMAVTPPRSPPTAWRISDTQLDKELPARPQPTGSILARLALRSHWPLTASGMYLVDSGEVLRTCGKASQGQVQTDAARDMGSGTSRASPLLITQVPRTNLPVVKSLRRCDVLLRRVRARRGDDRSAPAFHVNCHLFPPLP